MPTDADLDASIDDATGNAGADTTLETTGTDETRAADDTGEPKAVPYHRFQEVNQAAQAYKKYGKPEELADKLRRLDELEARDARIAEEARLAAEAEARKANPQAADAEDFVEATILKKFPHLKAIGAETERARIGYVERGFEDLPARLEKYGLTTTEDTIQSFRRLMENEILADKPGLGDQFWDPSTQRKAIDGAFERVKRNYIDPALRASGAKTLDAARERRARTLDRAATTGTARATPSTFTSKHAPGSVAYDRDRMAWRDKQMDIYLNADDGDEAVSL